MLHLWNETMNGIDMQKYMLTDNELSREKLGQRGPVDATIFFGTPRILMTMTKPTSLEHAMLQINSQLSQMGKLKYEVAVRPDMTLVCQYMQENQCFGPDDVIPGIDLYPILRLTPTFSVTMSDFSLKMPCTLESFEATLWQELNQRLGSTSGNITIGIEERRLHISLHNGNSYIGSRHTVTLNPSGQNLQSLTFDGSLQIDKFAANFDQEPMAAVFLLEYVITCTREIEAVTKTGWLRRKSTVQTPGRVKEEEIRVAVSCAAWFTTGIAESQQNEIKLSGLDLAGIANGTIMCDADNIFRSLGHTNETSLKLEFTTTPSKDFVIEAPTSPVKPVEKVEFREAKSKKVKKYKNAVTVELPVAEFQAELVPVEKVELVARPMSQNNLKSSRDNVSIRQNEPLVDPLRSFASPSFSRADRASLMGAGFEPVLDMQGHLLPITEATKSNTFKLSSHVSQLKMRCDGDKAYYSDIQFTFMGVSWSDMMSAVGSIFLKFRPFSFSEMKSDRLVLISPSDLSQQPNASSNIRDETLKRDEAQPLIIFGELSDGLTCSQPGLSYRYFFDSLGGYTSVKHARIWEQLHDGDVEVTIHSAESHFPIGVVSIPLNALIPKLDDDPVILPYCNVLQDLEILSVDATSLLSEDGDILQPRTTPRSIGRLKLRASNSFKPSTTLPDFPLDGQNYAGWTSWTPGNRKSTEWIQQIDSYDGANCSLSDYNETLHKKSRNDLIDKVVVTAQRVTHSRPLRLTSRSPMSSLNWSPFWHTNFQISSN